MRKCLGMYIHMHWGYNHPYAARTWTLDDWRGYAGGLSALGYNLVMIWPMLETMPDPPTSSDVVHLEKMRRVIDILHDEFGMQVLITLGPNVIGNDRAAKFTFEERPYFHCDLRLNPGDEGEVDRLVCFRRRLLSYLAKADGYAIIDSDPGGYIGSTNEEFTNLLRLHLALVKEYNPSARLYYWMWAGWESYNRMWQDIQENKAEIKIDITPADFDSVVAGLMETPDGSWGVLSCQPVHQETVVKYGIEDRALFFPYALVEVEPTFPRTNCDAGQICDGMKAYDLRKTCLGAMANSQTHAVQLPGAYLFAHFANGGTQDNVDLSGFAEGLVPGLGQVIADSWDALNSPDAARIRAASRLLQEARKPTYSSGPYSGLLFGSAGRFLDDLSAQLGWHADMREFASALERGADWHECLKSLVTSWGWWYSRTGFNESHCSPATAFIHEALRKVHDPELDAVLDDLESWRDLTRRHGLVGRLLEAMRAVS